MKPWAQHTIGFTIAAAIAFTAGYITLYAIERDKRERQVFIADCLSDHRLYECIAMWRNKCPN